MAGSPMQSVQFRSIVEPILNEEFDGVYDLRADEHKAIFKTFQGTPRAYHEEPVLYGMGAAPEMPEGTPVTFDAGGVLYIQRYMYKVYGIAFALTKVLVEDGDHIRIGQIYARHAAQSMVETKETLCANILNRAFNGSYTGGDGVALNVTTHPTATGSTYSNLLSTAANLSQTSVEAMVTQIRQATDSNGKKIRLTPTQLIVAPANELQAEVILKSVLRAGTANNDINPIKSKNLLSKGAVVVSRLTSATAWWIQTDAQDGLKLAMRRKLEKSMEGDFETDTMRYKSTERYVPSWTDPRGVYGTAGV